MQGGRTPTLIDGKLPVFIFPSSCTFYSDDQTSHKQVLTLYNPYEFQLRFKVLCTAPKKYSVVESEGSIKSRCCVDIVVRHKDININNEGIRDKFRVQISEYGQKTVIGKKDVITVLLPTKDRSTPTVEEKFEALPPPSVCGSSVLHDVHGARNAHFEATAPSGPSLVIVFAAVVCIAALMLPTLGDSESSLPAYLFLSTNQKLIAAYILGLVTMAILRS